MRKIYFLASLLLFLPLANCLSQSLFFEELNPSTWKCAKRINDSTLKIIQEIELSKINQKESLKQDAMLWSFKSGILTLSEYDSVLKREFIVSKYPYVIDFGKGILSIVLDDELRLNYKVGIISTGTFALLTKMKEKKK